MKNYFIVLIFLLLGSGAFSTPYLNSLPNAKATIFLDFDGHYVEGTPWNGGMPFNCAPSGLNDTQVTEVFNRVAEDFRPFEINITTDSTRFFAAPPDQRIRIIITLTSGWYTGVGGVSFTGSFTWGDDTPAFVFPDRLAYSPKIIAECCTHESGHTLGLSHQAKYDGSCSLVATYNTGNGNGQIGWAPVMGNSYYKNISGWNNGPTPYGCTEDQDNLSIITSRNGFTYRTDDHPDQPGREIPAVHINDSSFIESGIITTNTDKDVFKFVFKSEGRFYLQANPYSVGAFNEGANLDVKITLLNEAYDTIQVYDPQDILNVEVDTSLKAGTYYIVVEGAANINTSNYGSLGAYTLSGNFVPFHVFENIVLLAGHPVEEKHHLDWSIVSEEPVKNIFLESSSNGTIFSTLTTFTSGAKDFNFSPLNDQTVYYRIKMIAVNEEVVYSNVVSMRSSFKMNTGLKVSTLVQSDIQVMSGENYRYQLTDVSGRTISNGSKLAGATQINMSNCPNGIYILQIISNSQRTTQRIVRM
jgi:Secretion system C-terminal sorting domain